jgi:hypothetical protein
MTERVVEFGDTRYEFVEDAQGGHWWPDVTPQERLLVEEVERQQAGMSALLAQRAELADAVRALFNTIAPHDEDEVLDLLDEPHSALLRRLLEVDQ